MIAKLREGQASHLTKVSPELPSKRAIRELTSFSSFVLREAGWLEARRRATGAAA